MIVLIVCLYICFDIFWFQKQKYRSSSYYIRTLVEFFPFVDLKILSTITGWKPEQDNQFPPWFSWWLLLCVWLCVVCQPFVSFSVVVCCLSQNLIQYWPKNIVLANWYRHRSILDHLIHYSFRLPSYNCGMISLFPSFIWFSVSNSFYFLSSRNKRTQLLPGCYSNQCVCPIKPNPIRKYCQSKWGNNIWVKPWLIIDFDWLNY